MFEKTLISLLNEHLAPYVEGLDPTQLVRVQSGG